MRTFLLINPNTCKDTTVMMTTIARAALPANPRWLVKGVTVKSGPPMITDEGSLRRAAVEVVRSVTEYTNQAGAGISAIIVGAIGDPGLSELRETVNIPAFGLAESVILEAAIGGQRFGIVTTTPGLVNALQARVVALGMFGQYTGTRVTSGDPQSLVANPDLLERQLQNCVEECFVSDGAEAVIIGGGPLARAAASLQHRFQRPVLSPVQSAVHRLLDQLGD